MVVKVGLLRQKAYLRLDFRVAKILAQDCGRSCAGTDDPHQDLQRRGFAGAVRAEKAKRFPTINCQCEALERWTKLFFPEAYGVGLG